MQMHFFFSENVTLLFDFWTVQTLAGLVLSFLVVLLFTVLYEVSKVWKANLLVRVLVTFPVSQLRPSPSSTSDPESSAGVPSDPLLASDSPPAQRSAAEDVPSVGYSIPTYRWWFMNSSLALLHTAQVVLGYMLMLCVMSYNAAIFLAVIIGSALGYFLAFPLLSKYPKPHVM